MTTIQQVFDRAWRAAERRSWEYGRLGRLNADASMTIVVPNRTNFYFVRLGITGEQGLTTAHNAYGVAARDNLLVKMRRENGTLVIYEADATASSGDPDGGAGTWDVGVHALGGEYHSGNLPWARVDKTGASLADLPSRAHSALSGIGPNDHHAEATAGDGISLTGQQVAVNSTVVRTTRNLVAGSGLTGGGTLAADRTFNVGAGDGISVAADSVAVDSTVVRTSRTLSAGTGITGGGDLSANRSFAVNQAFAPTWTGVHTFNAQPVISNNLSFSGGSRTVYASDDLTLQPSGNLILTPSTYAMLAAGKQFRSSSFSDAVLAIAGFDLSDMGGNAYRLRLNTIKADELRVKTFVADETRVDRGVEYWSKSYGITTTDSIFSATVPGVGNITVEAPALTVGWLFAVGDWLRGYSIDWSTGITVENYWLKVTAQSSQTSYEQSYAVEIYSGQEELPSGAILIDVGQSGQGWVHLSALQSDGGPFVQVGTWSGSDPYTPANVVNRVRMGHLEGAAGKGAGSYGFAAGNNLGLTPVSGFKGLVADATDGAKLYNTDIEMYEGATKYISISQTDGIKILSGGDPEDDPFNERSILWLPDLTGPDPETARISAYLFGTEKTLDIRSGTNVEVSLRSGYTGTYVNDGLSNDGIWMEGGIVRSISPFVALDQVYVADKITHVLDTNTAIRFPANDTVTIETAGTERVRVDSTGRVGIGVTPVSPLTVKATSASISGGILLYASDGAFGSGLWREDTSAGGLVLRSQSIDTMIVKSGNVGIGTTSPGAQLDVVSGAAGSHALRLKAAASPTADIFRIINSSGSRMFSISASGEAVWNGFGGMTADNRALTAGETWTLPYARGLLYIYSSSAGRGALFHIDNDGVTVIYGSASHYTTTAGSANKINVYGNTTIENGWTTNRNVRAWMMGA